MQTVERTLASSMLEIGAVLLRPDEPFIWASGWHSPIYTDSRRIISVPSLRSYVADAITEKVRSLYPEADVVAGVATGAIAHGALVADRLGKPFIYVRSKPKDHGTGSQVEGMLAPGAKVVVIEDMVSTGKSSLEAVDALRQAGAEVLGMIAIFTYGFDLAAERFAEKHVPLNTLSDYNAIVEVARETGYIKEEYYDILREWRSSPSTWQ
ncbi:MAG: orotate phosphoribosyltransferase [Bacteroidales bacterium]|nr:orotate phosphoribosyltransferase [Bacteroidales bacterium]